MQKVRAQRRQRRAAAALVEVVQPVDDEAGLHAGDKCFHGLLDGRAALPRLGAFGGFDDHQTHAGGEVARIHGVDARHLARGEAGVLVAGGHLGADGDVDDFAAVRGAAAEKLYVVLHADRRGL